MKSCLRAWKEGGPSWCPPGEPCQSLAWAGLHPQLSLAGWRALRGSLFAGGRGRGGRRVAADPPAPQRARRPLHGGARPQPLHLLQVWGAEARGCPHGGGLGPGGLPSPLRPPSLPHPRLSFRMRQVNIVGTSPPSQPSRKIQTLQAPPHTHLCVLILASSLVLCLIPASFPITLSLAARGVSLKHKTVLEFLMAKTCQSSPILSREDLNLVWNFSLQNLVPAQPLSSHLLF